MYRTLLGEFWQLLERNLNLQLKQRRAFLLANDNLFCFSRDFCQLFKQNVIHMTCKPTKPIFIL